MVEFGSGYLMPMDRDYEPSPAGDHATNDVGVALGDLGMSLGLGPVPNVQAVGARLRAGSKQLEFVFTGAGKGSAQGQTPEQYGLKQRQALVELGQANKVDFTTHATVGVYGLAGQTQQGFSKEQKNMSVQEIKRAIEFAADVGKGGPVVVHTGEFHRPLVDAEWNETDEQWKGKFKMYEDEEGRTVYKVVDERTGAVIQEARKNRKVSRPEWNVAQPGQEYVDFDGTQKVAREGEPLSVYVDYFGKRLHPEERVPKFDKEKGQFVVNELEWKDLVHESKEMTERAREIWRDWKSGKVNEKEFSQSYWVRFKNVNNEKDIEVRPEEAYIISTLETNAANSRGWAHYYGAGFDEAVESVKKLRRALEFYQKIEDATSEEEKWKLKRQIPTGLQGLVPEDAKLPTEIIKKQLLREEGHMKQAQEASASQWAQAAEARETIRHVQSAETYALKEAYDAYAEAAIKAISDSDKLAKEGKLKRPLAIAMENLFPETYGAHPDEMIALVQGSRARLAELLKQRGMAEEDARKKAQQHITSTFDTGHLNMWRKYWKGDPDKSMAENDGQFNQWMLDKIGKMVDAGILGHVHLDDNYGYQDDHLAPGEGNAPIKEMVKLLKEKGYKGSMIVEPGADYYTDTSGFNSVMKTWRLFGSPVYGAGGGAPKGRNWGQVGYGFFGQNQPPYFVFGGYSPSEEWTLWSGVPLE
ncbi:sugar phosphate isomerase/epimerase [Candidatus Woesearchaeota archaeon]|nr:sugar phosphate isomerase/epimerase [Candidatus Woesearchaeota archaeon]